MAVSRHDQLIILSDPGSGKTTLLRYLALKQAQVLYNGHKEASPELGSARFPLLIRIAEFTEENAWKKQSLSDFFVKSYILHECPSEGLADLLHFELEQGNCLALLDGLDEIVHTDERQRESLSTNDDLGDTFVEEVFMALGTSGRADAEVVATLTEALHDEHPVFCQAAALSLKLLTPASTEVVDALLALLHDKDSYYPPRRCRVLGRIGVTMEFSEKQEKE